VELAQKGQQDRKETTVLQALLVNEVVQVFKDKKVPPAQVRQAQLVPQDQQVLQDLKVRLE
jgi:hypothetical protein